MTSTISQQIATLSTETAALTAAVNAAVTGFSTLQAQLTALQSQDNLSPADLASLQASLTAISTETAALAAVTSGGTATAG